MEEIKIQIPEGHEIDLEKSNLAEGKVVFKKKGETPWKDERHAITGFYIDDDSIIQHIIAKDTFYFGDKDDKNIFATEKQAKSALAMAQLSQIIQNDKRFGGPITDKEWLNDSTKKYCIFRKTNNIEVDFYWSTYYFLAFHTEEQRDLFLKENKDLIRQYLMLD